MAIKETNNKVVRVDVYLEMRELNFLKKLAAKEGLSVFDYISNIVRNWTKGQLDGEYHKLFRKMNILEKANLFGDVKKDGQLDTATSAVAREKQKIKDKYSKES